MPLPASRPDSKPMAHGKPTNGGHVLNASAAIPGAGLTRRPLLTAVIEGGKTIASVQSVQIDFAPAQATGIHWHPIPVVGQVTRGMFRFQLEGEPAHTLTAGSVFFEPANTRVLHFDNASDVEPASIVAFYLLGNDDRELITLAH